MCVCVCVCLHTHPHTHTQRQWRIENDRKAVGVGEGGGVNSIGSRRRGSSLDLGERKRVRGSSLDLGERTRVDAQEVNSRWSMEGRRSLEVRRNESDYRYGPLSCSLLLMCC
jgi:hypothetical protein